MELENIILCEVSQAQKTKSPVFSLIYRPKTNAAISCNTGNTRGGHAWEGRETKNLNRVDILSIQG
jgi:hypothetical protein